MREDTSKFPAESFKDSVLSPIFYDFQEHFLEAMDAINTAHCIMLFEQGILTKDEAERLLAGLTELQEELDLSAVQYTGEFEDVFFYLEHALTERIGTDTAGKLHTGRSRNDMDITMYKMKLKQSLLDLHDHLHQLIETLIAKAEVEKDTIVVAYTHGQPAQPTTFGHYLAAWIEVLLRDQQRFLHAFDDADCCSMGAAAITTTGFPLDRHRMAELLGFSRPQLNSYGCIAAADYLLHVYSALKILMTNIGRFSQDLNFQSSYEVAQIYVPNSMVQISSIMPQKRNPVPIEHLRLMASKGIGYCDLVMTAVHNTPFTDMNDGEDPVQMAGLQGFDEAARILPLLNELMDGVQINTETARRRIAESYCSITELADSLVRLEGLSFRQAHQITQALAKRAAEAGVSSDDMEYRWFLEAFQESAGRKPSMDSEELQVRLSPEHFVAVRERWGGPGPDALRAQLEIYRERCQALHDSFLEHRKRQDEAAALRKTLTAQYRGSSGA